jgi:hypothetical protein
MKRIAFWLVAAATLAGVLASTAPVAGRAGEDAAPIFGSKFSRDIATGG